MLTVLGNTVAKLLDLQWLIYLIMLTVLGNAVAKLLDHRGVWFSNLRTFVLLNKSASDQTHLWRLQLQCSATAQKIAVLKRIAVLSYCTKNCSAKIKLQCSATA